MREGELVREVEDQSIVNYEREIGELVREVEDQSAMTYEKRSWQIEPTIFVLDLWRPAFQRPSSIG